MTLDEAITKACKLTDGDKSDYDGADFYYLADTAQKWIARNGSRIERMVTLSGDKSEGYIVELPKDFYEVSPKGLVLADYPSMPFSYDLLHDLKEDGTESFKMVLRSGDKYILHYYAMPKTITKDTSGDYVFEVPIETHVAVPYFIGYHLVMDETTLYTQLKNEWNRHMSVFTDKSACNAVRVENAYRGLGRRGF